MKLALLLSGGKDSVYAGYLAKEKGNELVCNVSIFSENKDSYMFHTPSIEKTIKQSQAMNLPLIIQKTSGEKEIELQDLEEGIKKAKEKYNIEGIVTGAIESVYQASRIQKICNELDLEVFNPLWKKSEIEYLKELVSNNFKVIITGVFAFPLDKSWLGKEIDKNFINEVKELKEEYQIHPAGEGGEFETFVLNCPLFKKELRVSSFKDSKEGEYSWRREIEIE